MDQSTYTVLCAAVATQAKGRGSQGAASTAVFLVRQPMIARDRERFLVHCDPAAGRVSWGQVLEHDWTDAEQVLIRAAAWRADAAVEPPSPAMMDQLNVGRKHDLDTMQLAYNTGTVPAEAEAAEDLPGPGNASP